VVGSHQTRRRIDTATMRKQADQNYEWAAEIVRTEIYKVEDGSRLVARGNTSSDTVSMGFSATAKAILHLVHLRPDNLRRSLIVLSACFLIVEDLFFSSSDENQLSSLTSLKATTEPAEVLLDETNRTQFKKFISDKLTMVKADKNAVDIAMTKAVGMSMTLFKNQTDLEAGQKEELKRKDDLILKQCHRHPYSFGHCDIYCVLVRLYHRQLVTYELF
jgi:hypothetical protein